MTQHYRLLTKEEIARLEAQHCIASDWSGVEVADDLHTDYIHHTDYFCFSILRQNLKKPQCIFPHQAVLFLLESFQMILITD